MCNCWQLENVSIASGQNNDTITPLTVVCETSGALNAFSSFEENFFCILPANIPRYVVSRPLSLSVPMNCDCPLPNDTLRVPPLCNETNPQPPYLNVAFQLHFNGSCEQIDAIDEGVEFSFRNAPGEDWIPVTFYTASGFFRELIGDIDNQTNTISLRGYAVPIVTQTEPLPVNASLLLCGVERGVQLRWLQMAATVAMERRDVWILDNVIVSYIAVESTVPQVLIVDDFSSDPAPNPDRWLPTRNGLVVNDTDDCLQGENGRAFVFGVLANISGEGLDIRSRMVITTPLEFGDMLPSPTPTIGPQLHFTACVSSEVDCGVGLSTQDLPVAVEFRDIGDGGGGPVGEWQPIGSFTINASFIGGGVCTNHTFSLASAIERAGVFQFRVIQREHAGGVCNCWQLRDLAIAADPDSTTFFTSVCEVSGTVNPLPSDGNLGDLYFCTRPANIPRFVVSSTVTSSLVIESFSCPPLSETLKIPPICAMSNPQPPYLNVTFQLHVNGQQNTINGCDFVEELDEGVEFSIRNGPGEDWIPVTFYAVAAADGGTRNIIGVTDTQTNTITLRGYAVPIVTQTETLPVNVVLLLCGVEIGVQLRWLQFATFYQTRPLRDVWALDTVFVSYVAVGSTVPQVLFVDDLSSDPAPNPDRWLPVRNGLVEDGTAGCLPADNGRAFVFGRLQFMSSRFANFSRILVTTPLEFELGTTVASPTASPDTAPESLQETEARILRLIQDDPRLPPLLEQPPLVALENLDQILNASQDTPVESLTAVYFLGRILQNVPPGESVPVDTSEAALSVANSILEQSIPVADDDTVTDDEEIAGSSLLEIMENLTCSVEGLNDSTGVRLQEEQIVLRAFTVTSNSSDNEADTVAISVAGNELTLPNSLIRALNSNTVKIGSLFYKNMSGLLPGNIDDDNSTTLASSVLGSSLLCSEGNCIIPTVPPVRIVFQHLPDVEAAVANGASTLCVFWEFNDISGEVLSSGEWSVEGCSRNDTLSNASVTVCECSHLTNFAILLSPTAINFTEAQSISLQAIGAIGTAFSIIAMALTVVTFIILRSQWNMRNYIHINLCVSLSIAQLIFVAGVTPVGEGGVSPGCRAVAVLLHYFFLASFMWMLMEGVVLYVLLVKVFVFSQRPYIIGFTIASYGVPLLYLGITLPLGFALRPDNPDYGYGYAEACWLNPSTHFVFSFIAPVIAIILVNIGFFIMALVVLCKHRRKNKNNTRIGNAVHWLKGAVSLLVVMGIVWIMGVLVLQVDALLPVAYIFTILFAFQGVFIFVLFVLLQKPVRDAYKKWWNINVKQRFREKGINWKFLKFRSGGSLMQPMKSSMEMTNTTDRTDDSSSKDATTPAVELTEGGKKDLGVESGPSAVTVEVAVL